MRAASESNAIAKSVSACFLQDDATLASSPQKIHLTGLVGDLFQEDELICNFGTSAQPDIRESIPGQFVRTNDSARIAVNPDVGLEHYLLPLPVRRKMRMTLRRETGRSRQTLSMKILETVRSELNGASSGVLSTRRRSSRVPEQRELPSAS